ncbi:cation:proton antiporter [Actinoplanes sp. NPDC049265]|uniref:cation:proton antiporter n=1 Tax=Actinoplanes sp. NPDC049265 TaxID=3363902 RepID=UPI00371FA936
MNGVEILLIIGLGIAVSAAAKRRGVEPGLVIVVLAAAASFIPGLPRLELESELILAIVVPPLLYSGARGAAASSLGANLRPIITLGVALVVLTTAALGLISSWILPSMGLAAAFVLGAVLAPPDTITTVSHGGELGLPRRVTSILTGESLLNDATALTLFSIAVAAVSGESTTWMGGVGKFLYTAFGGLVVGLILGVGALWLRKRLHNPTLETSLVLLVPFTAFLLCEEIHASGILAVVAASFGVTANLTFDPKHQYDGAHLTRLQEDQVWPVLDFLLETFVFAYIGLQLKFVLSDLEFGLGRTLLAAGVLLVAAIAIRLLAVFVLFGRWSLQWKMMHLRMDRDPTFKARFEDNVRQRRGQPFQPLGSKEILLVSWTGMRGILTLAAAAAVPHDVPGRDAIQVIALLVTLGTLLIQGTTLRALARRLKLDLAAEEADTAAMRKAGEEIIAGVSGFDAQRNALGQAVAERRLDEATARHLIAEVDLRQAATR